MLQLMDILLISWWLGIASLVAQRLKRLPSMWETQVRSLGREDPLEKELATHSGTWRIPGTEETGGLHFMGSRRVGHNCMTKAALAETLECSFLQF